MFHAHYYIYIYLILVGVLTLIKAVNVQTDLYTYNYTDKLKVWGLGLFFILFFGFKPWQAGPIMGDTAYADWFNLIQQGELPPYWGVGDSSGVNFSGEFIFNYPRNWMALHGFDVSIWFTLVACVYIIPIIYAVKNLFPGHEYLAFLFFLGCMQFYPGGLNGVRNADACSLFFLGFSLLAVRKHHNLLGILFIIISYFIHHSIVISIFAFIISYFLIRNTKGALMIWILCITIALLFGNLIANYVNALNFIDDRASTYLTIGESEAYMEKNFSHTGFRWDFLIYSAVPIIYGWYFTGKKGFKDKTYQLLLNTYILANAIWIIFIYSSYTNRFAALSWALYPYVLCYPLIKFKVRGLNIPTLISLTLIGQFALTIILSSFLM